MNVLILGGSRFMGRHIAQQVLAAGGRASVLNRGTADPVPGVEELIGDRSKPTGLDTVRHREFDAVVDLSAYESAWVVQATAALAGRVGQYIFISSGVVYAPQQTVPWPETNPVEPNPAWGDYAVQKISAERHLTTLAEQGVLNSTSLRLPYVLGADNYADRESFVFSRLEAHSPILLPGGGRCVNQYVHVSDVARAVLACIAAVPATGGRAFNVGPFAATTNRGFVELCSQISGWPADIVNLPAPAGGERINLADVIYPFPEANFFLDGRVITEKTGFLPSMTLPQMLSEYLDWWLTQANRSPVNYPAEQTALVKHQQAA